MKMFAAILRVVVLLAATALAGNAADTNTPPEILSAVRAAKTIRIEVKQEFEKAPDVRLPFVGTARDVFALIGQDVVATGDAPAVLKVDAHGEALGGNYIGDFTGYHYSGAHVYGDIVLEMQGKSAAALKFDGFTPVAEKITGPCSHPSCAPFSDAMGGYKKALFKLLVQTHGLETVVAAATRAGKWDLQIAAVLASGESGRPEAVPPLIALLAKTPEHNDSLRAATALALARLGDARALPALVAAMDQGEANLSALEHRADSRVTFQTAFDVPSTLPPDHETDARRCILGAVRTVEAPDKVERLLAALRDKSSAMRQAGAALVLGSLRAKEAEPALIAALRDNSFAVRAAAASALGDLQSVAAVDALSTASKDVSTPVRTQAERALEIISAVSGDQILRKATEQPHGHISEIPREKLVDTFRSGNRLQRKLVVEQLSMRDDPPARDMELLELAVKDEWQEVRAEAVSRLGGFAPLPPELEQDIKEGRVELARDYQYDPELDKRALKLVLDSLQDKDPSVRLAAVQVLSGHYAKPEMLDTFAQLLKDEQDEIRRRAVWALGKIHDSRSVELLSNVVRDQSGRYWRGEAMKALGELNDPAAVPVLLEVLRDPYGRDYDDAAWALAAMGDKSAVDPLIQALRLKHPHGRQAIIRVLAALKDVRAVDPLLTELRAVQTAAGSMERLEAEAIVQALGTLGDKRAVEPLISLLGSKTGFERAEIIRALGELGDARAVEPLLQELRAASTPSDSTGQKEKIATVEALGKLAAPQAIEPLIALLEAEEKTQPAWPTQPPGWLGELPGAIHEALTAITRENFSTAADWRRWWTENKEKFKPKP